VKGSVVGTVAVFALVIPALVTVAVMASAYWHAVYLGPLLLVQIVLGGLPGGYLLGLPPALMTGLAAVWLSPRVGRAWLWAVLAAAGGAVFAVAAAFFLDPDGGLAGPGTILRLLAPAAAVASLAAALICQWTRLRPRSP